MPKIRLQGTDLDYTDADIITFDEGLIGMPDLHRMVLVQHEGLEPFFWLASLEDTNLAFLVVRPAEMFSDYFPYVSAETRERLQLTPEEHPLFLTTATITADWTQSTFNLRAPLVIAPRTMRGTQVVLNNSPYRLDASLPSLNAASTQTA